MALGKKKDSQDDSAKAVEKALREREKSEAREAKLAEREIKAQQRSADQKAREEEKIAKNKRELELYGRKMIEETCAGKMVRIYDKGFVRVSGVFIKDGAAFEKLRAISSSSDVAKKTALGRTLMFGVTAGLNVLTTPNKRGDIYLAITTDKTTHMLHMSPPTERDMKAMHKIESAGQGILDSLERQLAENVSTASPSSRPKAESSIAQSSVIDELTKLVALRDAGALTEDEFLSMKSNLMGDNVGVAGEDTFSGGSGSSNTQEFFDVELLNARPHLIATIKVVRSFTNLGLADAKELVDAAPSVVGSSLPHEIAVQFVDELRAVGATAEVRGTQTTSRI